jgi:hypothetical protein
MWLDQRLAKKKYFWWEKPKNILELEKEYKWEIHDITFDVISWRKANQIHKRFVMNVQNWDDDCWEYEVSEEQLNNLLVIVNKVIDSCELVNWEPNMEEWEYIKDSSLAEELLPNVSWFFFWSTNYDQWYLWDLNHTKEWLEKALANRWEWEYFYYSSSW